MENNRWEKTKVAGQASKKTLAVGRKNMSIMAPAKKNIQIFLMFPEKACKKTKNTNNRSTSLKGKGKPPMKEICRTVNAVIRVEFMMILIHIYLLPTIGHLKP